MAAKFGVSLFDSKDSPLFVIVLIASKRLKNEPENKIRLGKYNFGRDKEKRTIKELIDRYFEDGVFDHLKAPPDPKCHLNYFKESIGTYALTNITPELLTV